MGETAPNMTSRKSEHFDINITATGLDPSVQKVQRQDTITWHNKRTVDVWLQFAAKVVGPENEDDDDTEESFKVPAGVPMGPDGKTTKKAKKETPVLGVHYDVLTSQPTGSEAAAGKGPPTIIIQ